MTDFVAYYRISTQKQGFSGLGMEAQKGAVEGFVRSAGGNIIAAYEEVESGAKSDRPVLEKAMRHARAKKAVLIIAKLDRLARDVYFISKLLKSNVDFIAADMPHANKLTIHIIAAVAEYERDLTSKRTREALARAKARGVRLGNPNIAQQSRRASKVAVENANNFAKTVMPRIERLQSEGVVSLRRIASILNAEKIPTQRNTQWTATGVRNVIRRARALDEQPLVASSSA